MAGLPPRTPGRPSPQDQLTRDDLKGARRWAMVAAAWAVAATAIALIALLDTSGSDARKEADQAADRVARSERKLDVRLDALETRLDDLPRSEDVSKLQQRIAGLEGDATRAARDAKGAKDTAGDLEDRVQALEDTADADAGGDDNPDDDDSP